MVPCMIFLDNIVLQAILKKQYENEKKVAAICHGVCGLLNVTLASGEYLVKDKKLQDSAGLKKFWQERKGSCLSIWKPN